MATTPSVETAFNSAFQSAVTEHSAPAERAATPESVQATTPAETKPPDEAQAQPPVADGADDLLSREEIDKLKKDPDALEKAFKGAYTKKTQALSEQRKEFEQWGPLIESFKADPKATLLKLAPELGLTFAEAAKAETKAEVAQASEDALSTLRESLGPELAFLADKLAPALDRLVKQAVQPLEQHQQEQQIQAISKESESEVKAFVAKHPDWETHQPKMTALMAKMSPAVDSEGKPLMETSEYMEMIYHLASREQSEAERTLKLAEKMTKSAAKSETPVAGVQDNRVVQAPPKSKSMAETFAHSFAAAKEGKRYE